MLKVSKHAHSNSGLMLHPDAKDVLQIAETHMLSEQEISRLITSGELEFAGYDDCGYATYLSAEKATS